jgi:hypothetical protein
MTIKKIWIWNIWAGSLAIFSVMQILWNSNFFRGSYTPFCVAPKRDGASREKQTWRTQLRIYFQSFARTYLDVSLF